MTFGAKRYAQFSSSLCKRITETNVTKVTLTCSVCFWVDCNLQAAAFKLEFYESCSASSFTDL